MSITLLFLGIIFSALLIFIYVGVMGYPFWMGFVILLALAGIWLILYLIRKFWLKKQSEKFIDQLIEQDDKHIKESEQKDKEGLQEIQERWKQAVSELKKSELSKNGDPLYVLPWYLIIGEPGAGKTAVIKSSGLGSPFTETSELQHSPFTRNCDWWLFEKAIIIDTAGRFTSPVDEKRDKGQWQKFISLLGKYRKKEPLNGLIVTVPADKLLRGDTEELQEYGRTIRLRIAELMKSIGAKCPVYVLITKCDLIRGFTQYSDNLPKNSLNQAMGVFNQHNNTDMDAFHENVMQTTGKHLRKHRLILMQDFNKDETDLLFYPEEFHSLDSGLKCFLNAAFQSSPMLESPEMKGIYFSSACQKGSPFSKFLKLLGLDDTTQPRDEKKGLFLKDFFEKILPEGKDLATFTKERLEWDKFTRNIVLTSWILLSMALCGLLSFSFYKNYQVIKDLPKLELARKVHNLDNFQMFVNYIDKIKEIEHKNRNWWIPDLGLNISDQREKVLKDHYITKMREIIIHDIDSMIQSKMNDFSTNTATSYEIGQYIAHIVRRINIINDYSKFECEENSVNNDNEKLDIHYYTYCPPINFMDGYANLENDFYDMYLQYLFWNNDEGILVSEKDKLQNLLNLAFKTQRIGLDWMLEWYNKQASASQISIDHFWEGSNDIQDEIVIAPVFTNEGFQKISLFIKHLNSALKDPNDISNTKEKFYNNYHIQYIQSWIGFSSNFSKGIEKLNKKDEWQQVFNNIHKGRGPYQTFIHQMATELEPLQAYLIESSKSGIDNSGLMKKYSAWVELVETFEQLRIKAEIEQKRKQNKELLSKFSSRLSRTSDLYMKRISDESVQYYIQYKELIENLLTDHYYTIKEAHQIAANIFASNFSDGKSKHFRNAKLKVQEINNSLKIKNTKIHYPFWKLVNGPIDFILTLTYYQTACYIQNIWTSEILAEKKYNDLKTNTREALIFAKDKDMVGEFVKRTRSGGFGRKKDIWKNKIPFNNSFFSYLNKAIGFNREIDRNKIYNVQITGKLPNVEKLYPEKKVNKPYYSLLTLKCDQDETVLKTSTYGGLPKNFEWSYNYDCDDVTIQFNILGDMVTKKYSGRFGFAKFLKDFKNSTERFRHSDFSSYRDRKLLKKHNIKYIIPRYSLKGDYYKIIKLMNKPPGIPEKIIQCPKYFCKE